MAYRVILRQKGTKTRRKETGDKGQDGLKTTLISISVASVSFVAINKIGRFLRKKA